MEKTNLNKYYLNYTCEANHPLAWKRGSFLEDMNSNQDLICFSNGVFDTELLEFRKGKTSDNITFSTNTEYYTHDENNQYIKEVYKFLEELFPDKEVREYQLKKIASIFLIVKTYFLKHHQSTLLVAMVLRLD